MIDEPSMSCACQKVCACQFILPDLNEKKFINEQILYLMDIPNKLAEIKKKAVPNVSNGFLQLAFSCIDLTTLNSTDTQSRVSRFTEQVNNFYNDYPALPHVAAICVYPNMVQTVKNILNVRGVKIAAVAGGFPSSMTFTELKAEEARLAVEAGAGEVDVVLPLWAFLDGKDDLCKEEIETIKVAIGDAHLKVILESGVLAEPEVIERAAILAMEAGADFIKTSTGKVSPAATPEAALVMCRAVKAFYERTGKQVGFKPAGGISTTEEAVLYLTIVKEVLGDAWLTPDLFRIGASRLANSLLSSISGRVITYF